MEVIEDIYRRKVAKYAKGSCLDVGCGNGRIIDYVARKIPDREHVAIDMVNYATELKAKNVTFKETPITEFKTGQKFDTIIMLHVLEHLENPIGTLRKLYGMLNEGGKMVLAVPNRHSTLDARGTSCEEYSPHLWLWDRESLGFTLTQTGFRHFFIPFAVHIPFTRRIAKRGAGTFNIISRLQEKLGSTIGEVIKSLQWHLLVVIEK
jgi:SAM-dependent methyltransferase